MSVKLLDNKAFYGYRVRRTVAGKLYQEYFSLKNGGARLEGRRKKSVENEALARDAVLEAQQKRYLDETKEERCFKSDGTVRGISYLLKTEKSGNLTPIFQVGVASKVVNKTVCTSFSLNAHGSGDAWQRAVEAYAKHKSIRKNTKLYQRLLKAMPKVS
ncbi:Uncharacterised protein [Zhongshania aliphaticivorans]|uniref:Uncharacterized protein n=1 Tax=Zhongshania aliphaticivorans TaxID=1470434 RepID=A0A5S9NMZ9_9GAMM|nr:hypothetical protein [Zhongshania aliphaticivorans]CAA0091471.1 Uncharacterised protein [Zhongshania aliphaticivorans]CAA0098841.1 Uncharacterised protein [Zhongshania aliphaticivorans]